MFDRFTHEAKQAMSRSRQEALRRHHEYIDVGHLLLGLLRPPPQEVVELLAAVGVDPAALLASVDAVIEPGHAGDLSMSQLPFTPSAKRVLEKMMEIALGLGHDYLGVGHLLVAVVAVAKRPIATAMAGAGLAFEPLSKAFAARPASEAGAPWELTERRASVYSAEQVAATLAEMARVLEGLTGAAVEAEKFDAAALLRDLRHRVLQAVAKLKA